MLILLDVESFVVIPSKSHRVLEACEAVVDCALIRTCAHGRVAEGHELLVVGGEHSPGVYETFAEDDNHVATHQECGISLLGVINRGIVIDLELLIVRVVHQLL